MVLLHYLVLCYNKNKPANSQRKWLKAPEKQPSGCWLKVRTAVNSCKLRLLEARKVKNRTKVDRASVATLKGFSSTERGAVKERGKVGETGGEKKRGRKAQREGRGSRNRKQTYVTNSTF